jgi:hypothetical protein
MHMLLDLRGKVPSFIHISDGKLHDVSILDRSIAEARVFCVMGRGSIDFQSCYRLHQAGGCNANRAKRTTDAQRRYSRPTDRSTGVIVDQTLVLQGYQSAKEYPDPFRGIRYKDTETGRRLLFISNNTFLSPLSICSSVQAQTAGGAGLSVDQNAFAREGMLRNLGKRSKAADLDRRVGLRTLGHHQEAPQTVPQSVRIATDFERQAVRTNLTGFSSFAYSDSSGFGSSRQPADSPMKTLGQA